MPPVWIYVRATVNMAGVVRGDEFWIDANDPVFEPLLEARLLIGVDPIGDPPE